MQPGDMMAESDEAEGPARPRGYAAPALEKGIDILELLADQPDGLTISEIAQRLGRSISEIFRIIVVMERRRWLRKDPASDRYSVSYRMLDIAFRATPARALTHHAFQALCKRAKHLRLVRCDVRHTGRFAKEIANLVRGDGGRTRHARRD